MKLKMILALLSALAVLMCACSSSDDSTADTKDTVFTEDSTEENLDEYEIETTSAVCFESENYSIDVDMLNFYYFTDVYNMYQSYGAYLSYMSPDQSSPDFTKSLSEQYYDSENDKTWHEYFLEMTLQKVQLILTLAEEAKAQDFESNAENLSEGYIKTLNSYAEAENLSFDEYLLKYYGESVTEKVVKNALLLQYTASEYQTMLLEEIESGVTEEELEEYKAGLEEEVDDTPTRDVRHILLMPDTYGSDETAKAKAEEVLSLYLAGDKTEESFEALGEEYNEDGNNLYENVTKGQMVTEFEEWLFDSSRIVGDTGIVKTDYGYHIMYYVGEGLPQWKSEAIESIVDTAYQEDITALMEASGEKILQNDDNIALVPDCFPEEAFASAA